MQARQAGGEKEDWEEKQEAGNWASKGEVMAVSRLSERPMYPDEYAGTLKLVIVGPSGVGKSASELSLHVLSSCLILGGLLCCA
jgi:putative ribosome biogenesis GTPase RsgA